MKQVLVLAHATDTGATSVAWRLRRELDLQAVHLIQPERLSLAAWSHRIDAKGRAATRLTLPGCAPIASTDIGVAMNRIRYLPVPRFHRSSLKDRDYALAEVQALIVSWLAGLGGRALPPVRGHPWVTPWLPLQRWASAAAACGLPVAARTVTTSRRWAARTDPAREVRRAGERPRDEGGILVPQNGNDAPAGTDGCVLVAGEHTEGSLAERFASQCMATARMLGLPLLEFRFAGAAGRAELIDVDPIPALDRPAAVEATCRLLVSRLEPGPHP